MINRLLVRQIKDYVKTFVRPINLITTPEVVAQPPGNRIVVLSPHFDDDVIGCGGTLRKHIVAGQRVSVVYLTDGKEGDPSIPDKDLVSQLRKEEARRATTLLGIKDLVFLDEPGTKLQSTNRLLGQLHHILQELRPDLLYVPWFLDNHIDHFETNRILLKLSESLEPILQVAAYEVWTPILPNMVTSVRLRIE